MRIENSLLSYDRLCVGFSSCQRNKMISMRVILPDKKLVHTTLDVTRKVMTTIQNSSHPALSGADSLAASTSDILLLIGRTLPRLDFRRSGYGKIFDIPAWSDFPSTRVSTLFSLPRCPSGIFRWACPDSWASDPLRCAGDDCLHAGRAFQLASILGIHRPSRPPGTAFEFL